MADKKKVEIEILTEVKKSLTSLAKYTAAVAGVSLAVNKAINIVKGMTQGYMDQIIQETKLAAALKATGGAVGITKTQMLDYSVQLSRLTGIDDDAITGAQALMTTFTRIGKTVFPDAVEAAADMSAMFGQDLQQSVIQLGTALNDPIAGVGRLRRIGISFSEEQQNMIKSLVEQNDLLGAQKVILDELEVQIGGTAKMMGTTAVGAVNSLNIAWESLKDEGGATILEFIKPAVVELTRLIQKAVDARQEYQNWKDAVAGKVNESDALGKAMETQIENIAKLERQLFILAELLDVVGLGNAKTEGMFYQQVVKELAVQKGMLADLQQRQHELKKEETTRQQIAVLMKQEADAEAERQKHVDALKDAYAGTLQGQIDATKAQIMYFETFKAGPMALAVLDDLKNKLKSLEEQLYGKPEEEKEAPGKALFSDHDVRDSELRVQEFYSMLMDKKIEAWELTRSLQQQENELFAGAMEARAALIEKESELRAKEAEAMLDQYGALAEAMGVLLVDQEKGIDALKAALKELLISELKSYAAIWAAKAIAAFASGNMPSALGYGAAAAAATAGVGVVSALGSGGLVTGPTPAIVGERGPELVTPLHELGRLGGDTINVNINGSLIHEREIEDMIVGAVSRGTRGY